MCARSQFIPAKLLWEGFNPQGFLDGIFVIFRGYIDESYGPDKNVFAWSCVIARGKEWDEIERKWKLHLDAKNKALKKAGRPVITRYHASDCSSRHGEFEGWSYEERDSFVRGLFGVLKQVDTFTAVFDMQLDDLCDVFPEWAHDRLEAAYGTLTVFLMYLIGKDFKKFGDGRINRVTLFHDQTGGNGKYDPAILRAFNSQMGKPDFMYKDYFTTIAPLKWQDCIALQPADMVAFECFKEAQARLEQRSSRRSFKALLDLGSFGIHSKTYQKEAIVRMRQELIQANLVVTPNG